MKDCIFCKIAKNEISAYKIFENDNYLAFLDIFPVSRGMTVLIPKKHISSYIMEIENIELANVMTTAKTVGEIMDKKLPDNIRTTYLIEGLDVEHLHVKLIPFYKEDVGKNHPEKATDKDLQKYHKILIG